MEVEAMETEESQVNGLTNEKSDEKQDEDANPEEEEVQEPSAEEQIDSSEASSGLKIVATFRENFGGEVIDIDDDSDTEIIQPVLESSIDPIKDSSNHDTNDTDAQAKSPDKTNGEDTAASAKNNVEEESSNSSETKENTTEPASESNTATETEPENLQPPETESENVAENETDSEPGMLPEPECIVETDMDQEVLLTEPEVTIEEPPIEAIDLCDDDDEPPVQKQKNVEPPVEMVVEEGEGPNGPPENSRNSNNSEIIISADQGSAQNGLPADKGNELAPVEDGEGDLVIADDDAETITDQPDEESVREVGEETLETFQVEARTVPPGLRECLECAKYTTCSTLLMISDLECYICSDKCLKKFRSVEKKGAPHLQNVPQTQDAPTPLRLCSQCKTEVTESCISWEAMDFCNEECLAKYQMKIGAKCLLCEEDVSPSAMGKYCVRFGQDIKQFCTPLCLDSYKKKIKTCNYCQLNLNINDSANNFIAPVGKGYFRDYCSQNCFTKFEEITKRHKVKLKAAMCAVCAKIKIVQVEVVREEASVYLCTDLCLAAYKFVNKIDLGFCSMCKKYYDRKAVGDLHVFQDDKPHRFCSKNCMNIKILSSRKIIPCSWCRAKKYSFDMVLKKKLKLSSDNAAPQDVYVCSLNCLTLFTVGSQPGGGKREQCFFCNKVDLCLYHVSMSDGSQRSFCTYECVLGPQMMNKQSMIKPVHVSSQNFAGSSLSGGRGSPKILNLNAKSSPSPRPNTPIRPTISVNKSIMEMTNLANLQHQQQHQPQQQPITQAQQLMPGQKIPTSMISNLGSLKKLGPPPLVVNSKGKSVMPVIKAPMKNQWNQTNILVKPRDPIEIKNKMTQVRAISVSKGVSCKPNMATRTIQTDEAGTDIDDRLRGLIPVPVPIYVPVPMAMYSVPVPTILPIPIPVPVPIFIPTTKNSAKAIFEDIKRIQETMPRDPIEAEILMMAEMVAQDKKDSEMSSNSDSESSPPTPRQQASAQQQSNSTQPNTDNTFNPDQVMEGSNSFGDDMLQMALKMASEMDQPSDLEGSLVNHTEGRTESGDVGSRTKKRVVSLNAGDSTRVGDSCSKRRRVSSGDVSSNMDRTPWTPVKPDATMSLKDSDSVNDESNLSNAETTFEEPDSTSLEYTLGVNAWRHFAKIWNEGIDLGKEGKRVKTELLGMVPEELNYSLTLFMKEAKMADGSDYKPDAKFYLALGIQYYLYENGRVDNIFYDAHYESFTDSLDDEAKKFQELYPSPDNVITRVEEEHLWECKHLGASSPYAVLTTLLYFNTKYFNLTTVEEHIELSFSHVMKHYKRNNLDVTSTPSLPGKNNDQKTTLLRFTPTQAILDANPKKNRVYEQYANEETPMRCPVFLHEFYLSKCPESTKSRNDVFYLQPEKSCIPESPVWYSTKAISKDLLNKILNRVKMVKEINVSMLEQ